MSSQELGRRWSRAARDPPRPHPLRPPPAPPHPGPLRPRDAGAPVLVPVSQPTATYQGSQRAGAGPRPPVQIRKGVLPQEASLPPAGKRVKHVQKSRTRTTHEAAWRCLLAPEARDQVQAEQQRERRRGCLEIPQGRRRGEPGGSSCGCQGIRPGDGSGADGHWIPVQTPGAWVSDELSPWRLKSARMVAGTGVQMKTLRGSSIQGRGGRSREGGKEQGRPGG